MVIKAGLHKLLDRIATGKTLIRLLIQKQSDLVLPFLYSIFAGNWCSKFWNIYPKSSILFMGHRKTDQMPRNTVSDQELH